MQYPNRIQIETTSLCNADCVFCQHKTMKRKTGEMSWKLFTRIIEQCKEFKINYILPFLNGEPFMDSLFLERLEYINNHLPEVELEIFSNMLLLDETKLKRLSNVKNIRTIFMSLTSYDSDSCKKYMSLDFNKVKTNVLNLIKLNKEKKFIKQIEASSMDMGKVENDKFKKCWGNLDITKYFITKKENWLGKVKSNAISNQNIICPRAFHLCIYHDGRVPLCCFDGDAEYIFGNVNNQHLLEIYNSDKYKQYRQKPKKDLDPCNRCTV